MFSPLLLVQWPVRLHSRQATERKHRRPKTRYKRLFWTNAQHGHVSVAIHKIFRGLSICNRFSTYLPNCQYQLKKGICASLVKGFSHCMWATHAHTEPATWSSPASHSQFCSLTSCHFLVCSTWEKLVGLVAGLTFLVSLSINSKDGSQYASSGAAIWTKGFTKQKQKTKFYKTESQWTVVVFWHWSTEKLEHSERWLWKVFCFLLPGGVSCSLTGSTAVKMDSIPYL